MEQKLSTGREEMILKIGVRVLAPKPQKIRLIVNDAEQSNTVLTNRYNIFTGDKYFFVRMPLCPRVTEIQVFNEATGQRPLAQETTFEMIDEEGKPDKVNNGIYKMPLVKKRDVIDIGNPDVRQFITFAQQFCYNAGVMPTGTYENRTRSLKIKYMPTIIMNNGQESTTPARINEKTKIIDVSQKIFIPFTVPMRFAILCHEFSHCYQNADKYSEVEADLQGLLIYLGLGYPRFEAYQAFLETFIGAPSDLNKKRYNTVDRFINDFEQHKFVMEV